MRKNSSSKNIRIASLALATAFMLSISVQAATYTVVTNDSLYLIAKANSTTVAALKAANGLTIDTVYPGQVLTIPSSSSSTNSSTTSYTVQNGDTLYLIAKMAYTTVSNLKSLNGLTSDTIYPGQTLKIPSSGNTTGGSSSTSVSSSEEYILAQLVTAEAEGESYEGQVAVAATVLNRMKNSNYPSTIAGVVYQVVDGIYYQYSPVLDGRINCIPSASAVRAVKAALAGSDPSYGATGFYNPAKTTNSWVRSKPVTRVIGNHVFFK